MILSCDTETYKKDEKGDWKPILDATGRYFTVGCIYKKSGSKKSFTNREEMWQYILKLGETEYKRNRKLTVYMHNARYDFYNICNLQDSNIRFFSEEPFIVGYYKKIEKEMNSEGFSKWIRYAKFNKIRYKIEENKLDKENYIKISYNKEIIKFLDTLAIFKMSLEKLGNLIKVPKMNMPEELGKEITKEKMKLLGEYCMNDCIITIKAIEFLKDKLEEDGIKMRNICTINQVAINYIINELKKAESEGLLVKNKNDEVTEVLYRTKYASEVHNAYRGGYVRAWKTGIFNGVTDIDCNSLYPYALINMRLPDLRTERFVKNPLGVYKQEDLFNKIGVSRVMLKNVGNSLGLLNIRTKEKAYTPLKGKYIIGTYTHIELEEAIKEGYKVIDVEWSIIYEECENYLKRVYELIYKRRKESGNDFDDWFYKSIMNSSIGKFGQRKINQEIFIDSIEKIEEYIENNIKVLRGIENSTNLVYSKQPDEHEVKKYYAPIIPALVTAFSRVYMYKQMKKIGEKDLLYMDTDSLVFQGEHIGKFIIGEKLGEFKIEKDIVTKEDLVNVNARIWGTKTKRIGNNLAISGVWKKDLTVEEFESGKVKSKRMMGIRNNKEEEVGKFIEEERSLVIQEENFAKSKELMDEQKVYIDCDIENISYFIEKLNAISDTLQINSSTAYKQDTI